MTKGLPLLLAILWLLPFNTCFAQDLEYVPGEILVKFKPKVKKTSIQALVHQRGLNMLNEYERAGILHMQLPAGSSVATAVADYSQREDVELAQPNYIHHRTINATPNDTSFDQLWGLHNTGQSVNGTSGTNDADIDAPGAWDSQTGSSSIVVAVIDTGADWDHPDLSANIWSNSDEVAANGIDDDGNGYIDDVRGWDFINNDNNPTDDNNHGSEVSGVIGAVGNNSAGVTGVCWQVKIMPLKWFDSSGLSGTSAQGVAAINYAVNNGAKVINASYSASSIDTAERSAISSANDSGVLFVAAAGNGGSDSIGDNNDSTPQYPAGYSLANIIAVTATNQNDVLASFSNFGATEVDVAAPGVNIYATIPNDTYAFVSGTSFSTAYVSGLAALLLSQYSGYTPAQLRQLIMDRVDTNSGLTGKVASNGRINAQLAFQIAPPASFSVSATTSGGSSQNNLSWTNPLSPLFSLVMIRFRTDGSYPANSSDGTLLVEQSGSRGSAQTYTHTSVTSGTTYHYAAFGKDTSGNFSSGSQAAATAASTATDSGGGGGGGGGCFIATACYGNSGARPVRVLTIFRDQYLLMHKPGRIFVSLYYRLSPGIAELIRHNDTLRSIIRFLLDRILP